MNTFFQPPEVDPATGELTDAGRRTAVRTAETVNEGAALRKAVDDAAEKEAQDAQDAYERRVQLSREKVRREREEAAISGTLAPEAELFRDGVLRKKVAEAHDFEPVVRTPIVQNLFFKNSLTWVAGESGTFKSFVTADLAFRYGSEGEMDYHGKRMTHGRALLVIAEGAAGYADRKVAWEKHHGREVKNVSIFPAPLQLGDTLKEMPALISYLTEEAEAGRPFDLILFDTQAMCTVGVDENSSEMNLVTNVLHRIREVNGACVMVVHHFGKQKSAGMRGSSMIYAAADTVCVLKRKEDGDDVLLSTAQADGGKQKDAITEKDLLAFEMAAHPVGVDFFGDTTTSLVPVAVNSKSTNTTDGDELEVTEALPPVSEIQLYYLKGIATFEVTGAKPANLAERMTDDDWYDQFGDPPLGRKGEVHRVTRTSPANQMQALFTKRYTEPVGSTGAWRITPLGVAKIAQTMTNRRDLEDSWMADAARRRTTQGTVQEGSELFDSN